MGPIIEKIIILVGMFVATITASLLPLTLVSSSGHSRKLMLSLCSCFSGGVFLSALFLDLMPDTKEAWDSVLDEYQKTYKIVIDYPVQQFVLCFGFFLVFIIEQMILEYKEGLHTQRGPIREARVNDENAPLLGNGHSENGAESRLRYSSNTESLAPLNSIENPILAENPDGQHDHTHMDGVFHHSTLRSLILLMALSFHSVFEGLAIGLQESLSQLISLFLAVIAHKGVMAFSLGLTLAQAKLTKKQFVMSVLVFSLASPLGMAIGIFLSDLDRSLGVDFANAILQTIAGGTFLYVTFFEVLPHEFNQPKNRMLKVLFVLLGFSCIAGLIFITH